MYLVDHYNFGLRYQFETLEEAEAFCKKAGFEASVWRLSHDGKTAGDLLVRYSPISGWSLPPLSYSGKGK